MPKPQRKHPGMASLETSPQGSAFVTLCLRILGTEQARYKPLETFPNVGHIFFLDGDSAYGYLIESVDERASGGIFVGKTAFLSFLDEDQVFIGEITTQRWDAWAEASETGDRSLIEGPPKKMYKARDVKNAKLGTEKDRVSFELASLGSLPRTIAGIATSDVLSVLEKVRTTIVAIESEMHEAQRLIDEGNADQSLSHWLQAGEDAAAIGRGYLEAAASFGAASAYGLLGRIEEEITFLTRSATMYRNLDMPADAGNGYTNIATVLAIQGRHDESLPSWQRAIGLLEQAGQTQLRARTHWGWARSLAALDDTDAAAAQYLRARLAFEDCGNYDSALEVHAEMTTVNERS